MVEYPSRRPETVLPNGGAVDHVTRDGLIVFKFRCPKCETWADIDADQFDGKVSMVCPNEECDYHETRNLTAELSAMDRCPERKVEYPGVEDIDYSCTRRAGHDGEHLDPDLGAWTGRGAS